MPASRAASGLPPTATVRRPKVVRLSSTQPSAATTTQDDDQQRDAEAACVVAMPLMIGVAGDLGLLAGDLRGQAAGGDQHRQRGDERAPAARTR